VFLIVGGLFKKVIVANYLSTDFVDDIFRDPAGFSSLDLLLGMYAYALQIYCDFSAYTDIAIGIAKLLGYEFPQNFNQPYRALTLQDFWRRWHMSLSSWLRDYLYIPLGGSRGGALATCRNIMITMGLGGLWHGASWNFVIWGLWHGSFLVIERVLFYRGDRKARREQNSSAVSAGSAVPSGVVAWPLWPHVYTMAIVMIGWVFFRAETLTGALAFLTSLAGMTAAAPTPYTIGWYLTPELWLALAAGAIGSTPWVPALAARIDDDRGWGVPLLNTAVLVTLLLLSIMSMAARTYNPFIYFRF
jgi:D-alanyl-lipoteichoic acid acyltransferase DltB (MBOAT superfamily)